MPRARTQAVSNALSVRIVNWTTARRLRCWPFTRAWPKPSSQAADCCCTVCCCELEPDPSGAFAPMGGVFSTVTDLAGWVAGFAAAFPARDDEEDRHPLRRASRREMQLPQVAI